MTDKEWDSCHRCMEVFLSGHLTGIQGEIIHDDFFLICINAHHESVTYHLPALGAQAKWERVLDTAIEEWFLPTKDEVFEKVSIEGRSLTVLRLKEPEKLNRAAVMDNF